MFGVLSELVNTNLNNNVLKSDHHYGGGLQTLGWTPNTRTHHQKVRYISRLRLADYCVLGFAATRRDTLQHAATRRDCAARLGHDKATS